MAFIRRLGVGETWLALLHDKAHGTAQTTNLLHVKGAIDNDLFQLAIRGLYQRYQQLAARLIETETGYQLIQDVPLTNISIQFDLGNKLDDWQSFMQQEANHILKQDEVLWRARLVSLNNQKEHFIFLTIHHAIADGLSAVALFETLLYYFHHPNDNDNLPTIALPPSIEVLYQPPTIKPDEQTIELLTTLDTVSVYVWPHQIPTPIDQRTTHFIFSFYPYTRLHNLLIAARKNGVTLNSLLNACMLLTAGELLQQPFNGGLSTPVNLRNHTNQQVNQDNVAFLCGVINTKHPDIQKGLNVWQLAKAYQEQIRARFATLTLANPDYDFATIKSSMTALWDPHRTTFCYDFMVTNLGLVKFQNVSADFDVQQFRFGTCRSAGDNNMMLLVSATDNGLFLTFGYPSPLITDHWAQNFVHHFNAHLQTLFNN